MPLPSNENDLKRRARRRLIGAVALTLLAVIVLPLLLEDEPPPASSLAVRMATPPATHTEQALQPVQLNHPNVAPALSASSQPEVQGTPPSKPEAKPAPKPEPVKSAPVKAEPAKSTPKPAPTKPSEASESPAKPATAASDVFVVQLAALSDPAKAEALKARAAKAGLPAFTDKVGNLTRVRVGPYPSRAAAVAAAVKLAEHNMAGQVLTK